MKDTPPYDIAIIGGGINGVGIAVEAAGRGLSVFLCEKDDFASHTSSASTKLIHGGLRYLEQYEFRLVREALSEREVLMHKAPHLIRPLEFIMPHNANLRPAWMIRLGLFLYDHLGSRKRLAKSQSFNLLPNTHNPLKSSLKKAFSYLDCSVDDARLVILNALRAQELGAHLHTRSPCTKAYRKEGYWHVCYTTESGETKTIQAKVLVNATGPWVKHVLEGSCGERSPYQIKMVQGSHIVLKKQFEGNQAYILQHSDKRIIFAIPYLDHFTMVGTTDQVYTGSLDKVAISQKEIDYLCEAYNVYFTKPISPQDVVSTWSGVRPLLDDGSQNPSETTRDYQFDVQSQAGALPLLSVFGGKITTYRQLAKQAIEHLSPFLRFPKHYDSAKDILPGGNIPNEDMAEFINTWAQQAPWLPPTLLRRLAMSYGTRLSYIIGESKQIEDLGKHYGSDLYEAEVHYLRTHEWAKTDEDILFRRTKVGVHAGEMKNIL